MSLDYDKLSYDKHIDIIRIINLIGYLYGLFAVYPLVRRFWITMKEWNYEYGW